MLLCEVGCDGCHGDRMTGAPRHAFLTECRLDFHSLLRHELYRQDVVDGWELVQNTLIASWEILQTGEGGRRPAA